MSVRRWLATLGLLVAGAMPAEEARIRIEAFAPLLEDQFPACAFTAASLQAVARGAKFFPAYAELAEALSGWLRENRAHPSVPMLEGPTGAALTSEEAVFVAIFLKRLAERGMGALRLLLGIARTYPEGARRAIEAEFGPREERSVRVRAPMPHTMPGTDRREAGEPHPPPNPRQSRGGDDW
ncbi:hypothetical protein [Neoroseomonas rubea]|uniref:hypothetical protein n=1 Tax=Neoroseomonas rubea TaxID=2748666 RepID=UPI0018E05E50|nr:hypothetical protein [Roseomonas rubea]